MTCFLVYCVGWCVLCYPIHPAGLLGPYQWGHCRFPAEKDIVHWNSAQNNDHSRYTFLHMHSTCCTCTVCVSHVSHVAFSFGATFLLLCGYFGDSPVSAVSLLTVAVGFQGCALAGFNINHLDIAPRYSGVLMGITNTVATLPGFIGPIVAKAIAHEVCVFVYVLP